MSLDPAAIVRVERFLRRHHQKVTAGSTKLTAVDENISTDDIRKAFKMANKTQLLMMMDYGIDILMPFSIGKSTFEANYEHKSWILDFYGIDDSFSSREDLNKQRTEVMQAYKRCKWKIGMVGGSVAHWNQRRSFILFLEKFVIHPTLYKNIYKEPVYATDNNTRKILFALEINTIQILVASFL
jgi:hypothetical protein